MARRTSRTERRRAGYDPWEQFRNQESGPWEELGMLRSDPWEELGKPKRDTHEETERAKRDPWEEFIKAKSGPWADSGAPWADSETYVRDTHRGGMRQTFSSGAESAPVDCDPWEDLGRPKRDYRERRKAKHETQREERKAKHTILRRGERASTRADQQEERSVKRIERREERSVRHIDRLFPWQDRSDGFAVGEPTPPVLRDRFAEPVFVMPTSAKPTYPSVEPTHARLTASGVATLANALTVCRFACTALIVMLLFSEPIRPALVMGVILLVYATDIFDGLLARSRDTATRFGARLDIIADLVFVLSVSAAMVARTIMPWLILACIAGEVVVYLTTSLLTTTDKRARLAVEPVGKLVGLFYAAMPPVVLTVWWLAMGDEAMHIVTTMCMAVTLVALFNRVGVVLDTRNEYSDMKGIVP